MVTSQELEALLEKIDYLAKGANYVVLAGSLPRRVPEDFYAQVLQRLRRTHCVAVLDSAGEPLRLGVRGHPHVVTPNVREAEDLVGHEFHDLQDIVDATEIIREMGAQSVIIKMPDGCVARIKQGRHSRVYHATIPLLENILQTVGSGDAFVAGFISWRFDKKDVSECLRYGLACGAANTQLYGAGVLDPAEVDRLFGTTFVTEVKESDAV